MKSVNGVRVRALMTLGLLVPLAAGACAGATDGREARISARLALTSPAMDPVSIEFTAKNTGPHIVVLEFPWPVEDETLRALVNDARATTGSDHAPTFAFSWQLKHAGQIVSQRPSPLRSTASIDNGTGGLGGGSVASVGLAFGGFDLVAGEGYSLRILPDFGFGVLTRGRPTAVVQLAAR